MYMTLCDQGGLNSNGAYAVWSQCYKTFFMLNSSESEHYPARKCLNANNCWHFNIY